MEIPVNKFKHAITENRLQIGLWSQLVSTIAVEVLADAGYDFVVVDAEHAPNDLGTVMPMLQILDRSPASAIVRVPWRDMVLFKRYLDIGAQTLLIPFVETPEQAAEAVAFSRYPPAGVRGVAGCHRANRFGRVGDYLDTAASEICLVVQLETRLGLENLEAIAAIDGVDAVFIGPADLSASFGHLGNPGHPEVQEAIAAVPGRLKASGKPGGILAPVEATARLHLEQGFAFVAVGNDLSLLATHSAAVAKLYEDLR